jgi:hypothetical protein
MKPCDNTAACKRQESQEPHAPGIKLKVTHRPVYLQIRDSEGNALRKAIDIERTEEILLEPPRLE